MPLLMVQPGDGTLPPEADVLVAGGRASSVRVACGQLLSIETPDGGQVAALFSWTAADRAEWLSLHHTRVFGGTFEVRMGTRMVTNRRRPMFVVGRDSVRRHDLLLPASEETVYEVRQALAGARVVVSRVPDPVNLFLDSRLGPDGGIEVRGCPARPGDRWTARVLIDADVVIAAGRPGIRAASANPPRALRVRVVNLVEDLPGDLPILVD